MWVANLERRHQGLIRHCCFWILSQILRWYHPAMVFGFGLFIHTRQYGPWLVSYLISKSWTEQKGLATGLQVDEAWAFQSTRITPDISPAAILTRKGLLGGRQLLPEEKQYCNWQSMSCCWPIERPSSSVGVCFFFPPWRISHSEEITREIESLEKEKRTKINR